jgi:hypothetical protein
LRFINDGKPDGSFTAAAFVNVYSVTVKVVDISGFVCVFSVIENPVDFEFPL